MCWDVKGRKVSMEVKKNLMKSGNLPLLCVEVRCGLRLKQNGKRKNPSLKMSYQQVSVDEKEEWMIRIHMGILE